MSALSRSTRLAWPSLRVLLVIVVELAGCTSVKFGFPGDEALHGHPLYDAGLTHYQLHEMPASAWLTQLRTVAAVHRQAPSRTRA